MSVGHLLCGSPIVSLWVPVLDRCLWVTLSVCHLLFIFGSLGLISVCGSASLCYISCFSLGL